MIIFLQLKVDTHAMNVPASEEIGDDKNLLSIKQAIQAEINERIKDLEERVAAIERKLAT